MEGGFEIILMQYRGIRSMSPKRPYRKGRCCYIVKRLYSLLTFKYLTCNGKNMLSNLFTTEYKYKTQKNEMTLFKLVSLFTLVDCRLRIISFRVIIKMRERSMS